MAKGKLYKIVKSLQCSHGLEGKVQCDTHSEPCGNDCAKGISPDKLFQSPWMAGRDSTASEIGWFTQMMSIHLHLYQQGGFACQIAPSHSTL